MTNLPVGFTKKRVSLLIIFSGRTGLIISLITAFSISSCSISGSCWVDKTIVSIETGVSFS